MSTITAQKYDVEINFPGSREWCEEVRDNFADWLTGLANSAHSEAMGVVPAISVELDDQGEDVHSLRLVYAEIPAATPAGGLKRALKVTEMIFGEQGLAPIPAMGILVWEQGRL